MVKVLHGAHTYRNVPSDAKDAMAIVYQIFDMMNYNSRRGWLTIQDES